MPSIKLQSSDGEIFEVDVEIAKQSVTIKTIGDENDVATLENSLVGLFHCCCKTKHTHIIQS
uniref:SKP1 component POZ domain-containing protein n=1 Tax=Moschus moschiferus TaxID=68415 RepID=A0A8C6CPL9_MOSMO